MPSENTLIKIGVLTGYIVGGVLGAIAFDAFELASLYFAAAMTVLYWLWGRKRAERLRSG